MLFEPSPALQIPTEIAQNGDIIRKGCDGIRVDVSQHPLIMLKGQQGQRFCFVIATKHLKCQRVVIQSRYCIGGILTQSQPADCQALRPICSASMLRPTALSALEYWLNDSIVR